MIVIFYCPPQKDKLKDLLNSQIFAQGIETKTVALPCLAKLEVTHLLKALETGAKGVAVWGCADQDCLYHNGHEVALGRTRYTQRILKEIGAGDFILQYFSADPETSAARKEKFINWLKNIFPPN
ncbi:MAG: hydrogenase iron-sulfur subunit [Thermodesulfobacteriota bacterium]